MDPSMFLMAGRSAQRQPRRAGFALAAAIIAVGAFSGCGGSDDSASKQLELQQARAEGRAEAVAEQRAKRTAADAAALRKELAQLRKEQRKGTARDSSSKKSGTGGSEARPSGGAASSASGSSAKSCGDGITANSVTSWEFARAVRDDYYSGGQSSQVSTFSPVTGQAYAMSCSGSGAVTCRGGNGASVTFP